MENQQTFSYLRGFLTPEIKYCAGVVAHDAGGANQLIALLKACPDLKPRAVCMEGPALYLWQKAFPEVVALSLDQVLAQSAVLLTGSGWASDLEFQAISQGRKAGIKVITILDHWVNYPQRFIRNDIQVWPDEFWVVDEDALKIAEGTFRGQLIRQIPDYYMRSQASQIAPIPQGSNKLLYLLEPVRSNWGRGTPGEFQALDYFMQMRVHLDLPDDLQIILRPHPSESAGKYFSWVERYSSEKVCIQQSGTLCSALSAARWVAGCESYAMAVALASGRRVFCTLPPWAPTCRLPHENIYFIRSKEILGNL